MNPSLEYFQAYWWPVEEAMRLPSRKPQNATFAKMMARQIGRSSFLMDFIKNRLSIFLWNPISVVSSRNRIGRLI
jgi:hypothetical protein